LDGVSILENFLMLNFKSIEINRKILLIQQTRLRELMERFDQHELAIDLFFRQHAQLHRSTVSDSGLWSFADAVLVGLTTQQIRRIPDSSNHSIAWCLWHISRIEDATMNLLVAGKDQVFNRGDWGSCLEVDICNTGNGMSDKDVTRLSEMINPVSLLDYRDCVGKQTRQVVAGLKAEQLPERVQPERIERLLAEGVLLEAGRELADYWGNRTIAGLLLMPATRHNLSHLNECLKLRKTTG
jgi:hypothetical protein